MKMDFKIGYSDEVKRTIAKMDYDYMERHVRDIHRGSLDFAEFVIDPSNKDTEWPGEVLYHLLNYCGALGMNPNQFRQWLLEVLREERRKREQRAKVAKFPRQIRQN